MPLNSGLFVRMGVSNKSDVSITLGNWRLGELKKPLFYQEETFFLVVSHYFYCAKKVQTCVGKCRVTGKDLREKKSKPKDILINPFPFLFRTQEIQMTPKEGPFQSFFGQKQTSFPKDMSPQATPFFRPKISSKLDTQPFPFPPRSGKEANIFI